MWSATKSKQFHLAAFIPAITNLTERARLSHFFRCVKILFESFHFSFALPEATNDRISLPGLSGYSIVKPLYET